MNAKGQQVSYYVYTNHYGLTVDDSYETAESVRQGTISSVGKRFAKVRNAATGKIESVPTWRIINTDQEG